MNDLAIANLYIKNHNAIGELIALQSGRELNTKNG